MASNSSQVLEGSARANMVVSHWVFVFLAVTIFASGVSADEVILDPDVIVTGTAGLSGEIFANGNVSAYTNAGNSSSSFGSDGEFAISVPPGQIFRLYLNMYSFQGTSNARLIHDIRNLPALVPGEDRYIDLRRLSGRILGTVNVTGGTLERLVMNSYSVESTLYEYFNGYAISTDPSAPAIQPMPVVSTDTRVYGSAQIRTVDGCATVVSLANKYVAVSEGQSHSISWDADVSTVSCSDESVEGSVEGRVELPGLPDADPAADLNIHRVNVYGPMFASTSLTDDGSYVINGLKEGTYSTRLDSYFHAPYGYLSSKHFSNAIQVVAGQVSTHDIIQSVGVAAGTVELVGAWGTADLYSALAYLYSVAGATAYDQMALSNGRLDFVLTPDNWRRGPQVFYYSNPRPGRWVNGSVNFSPVTEWFAGPSQGTQLDLGTRVIMTASTNINVTLAQPEGLPEVGITRLQISGSASLRDPITDVLLGSGYLSLSSNLQGGGVPTTDLNVKLNGLPGTYAMQATADGTDGRVYRNSFQLTLGNPEYTPEGEGIVKEFPSETGNDVSLTFENVVVGGETTVSQLTLGPEAPDGFGIIGAGESQEKLYFDVVTTAQFEGEVEICIAYDDTDMPPGMEQNLDLGHYTCDENLENCTWEIITSTGSPDVDNNVICGVTDDFSIFAILEKIILDTDGDGIIDEVDNCPLTPNADQADLDGDGIGDACDEDNDGDGIVNDEDLCPNLATADNADLDGDGIGNACDPDIDGDGIDNVVDNCPLTANPDQVDFDSDGAGDACDIDDDEDYVLDSDDACPGTSLGAVIDDDGCASDQRLSLYCPVDADYRNHGEYVSCVAHEVEDQVDIGLITPDEGGAIKSTAAQSDIGNKSKE